MASNWVEKLYVCNVILVRHAESRNNCLYEEIRTELGAEATSEAVSKEEQVRRHPDCSLSARGFSQVDKFCRYLGGGGWDRILPSSDLCQWSVYTSPMNRCLLTSLAIQKGLNATIQVDPTLYETGGCFQKSVVDGSMTFPSGMSTSEVQAQFPGYACLPGMENGWGFDRTRKETEAEFDARCAMIADRIWSMCINSRQSDPPLKGVVLVAHGNVLSGIINCLFTGSSARNMLFVHENVAYTHMELHYDGIRDKRVTVMKQFNVTTHLHTIRPDLPCAAGSMEAAAPLEITRSHELCTGGHTVNDFWIQDFLETDV